MEVHADELFFEVEVGLCLQIFPKIYEERKGRTSRQEYMLSHQIIATSRILGAQFRAGKPVLSGSKGLMDLYYYVCTISDVRTRLAIVAIIKPNLVF